MEVLLNSSADSVSMIWISHPHTLPQVPCRAYFTPHGHSISSQVTEFIMFDVVHVKITQAYGHCNRKSLDVYGNAACGLCPSFQIRFM